MTWNVRPGSGSGFEGLDSHRLAEEVPKMGMAVSDGLEKYDRHDGWTASDGV